MDEPKVTNFTKAELSRSDRPSIALFEMPSVLYSEYEYGLFMIEGEIYLKTGPLECHSVDESEVKFFSDKTEIYPLNPDWTAVAKATLNKYSKVLDE